jgi:hypothetical protein
LKPCLTSTITFTIQAINRSPSCITNRQVEKKPFNKGQNAICQHGGRISSTSKAHCHAFQAAYSTSPHRFFPTRSFLTHIKDFRTPETYAPAMTSLVSSGAFAWTLH